MRDRLEGVAGKVIHSLHHCQVLAIVGDDVHDYENRFCLAQVRRRHFVHDFTEAWYMLRVVPHQRKQFVGALHLGIGMVQPTGGAVHVQAVSEGFPFQVTAQRRNARPGNVHHHHVVGKEAIFRVRFFRWGGLLRGHFERAVHMSVFGFDKDVDIFDHGFY